MHNPSMTTHARLAATILLGLALSHPALAQKIDHVIIISVDGLRPDALDVEPGTLPALEALAAGSSTPNARTDLNYTITLPNHVSMITGRPVTGEHGHGWLANIDPPQGVTLHSKKGTYIPSAFDVAHDRDIRTALFASKTKFSLLDVSWNEENGAPDETGTDNGRDKIDLYTYTTDAAELATNTIDFLNEPGRSLTFLHYWHTDTTGHASGWELSKRSAYMRAVKSIDDSISQVLKAIQTNPALRGKTAIILTADHGGGEPLRGHFPAHEPVNYTVPFFVWLGDNSADLYKINPKSRTNPAQDRIPNAPAPDQPIRNGDAANLALHLLGLPPVPGSIINARQDLRIPGFDDEPAQRPAPEPAQPEQAGK